MGLHANKAYIHKRWWARFGLGVIVCQSVMFSTSPRATLKQILFQTLTRVSFHVFRQSNVGAQVLFKCQQEGISNTQALEINSDTFPSVPVPVHFCACFHLHFWLHSWLWVFGLFSNSLEKKFDQASHLQLFLLWLLQAKPSNMVFSLCPKPWMSLPRARWGVGIWPLKTIIWISQITMQNNVTQTGSFFSAPS